MATRVRLKPQLKDANGRPTLTDLAEDNFYSALARNHWHNPTEVVRYSVDVVKDIYSRLEKDRFDLSWLLLLDNLQYVERYVSVEVYSFQSLPHWM